MMAVRLILSGLAFMVLAATAINYWLNKRIRRDLDAKHEQTWRELARATELREEAQRQRARVSELLEEAQRERDEAHETNMKIQALMTQATQSFYN